MECNLERQTTSSGRSTASEARRLMSAEEAGKPSVLCPDCGRERPYLLLQPFGSPRLTLMPCECRVAKWRAEEERYRLEEERRRIERLFSMASIGEELAGSSFEKFDRVPGTEQALEECMAYAACNPREHNDWLLIYGIPGNGKSMLAAAVCNAVIARGIPCIFSNVPELLQRIRHTYDGGAGETETELYWEIVHAPLVVIDDLGAQRVKRSGKEVNWAEETLYKIVDARVRHARPTIITANADKVSDLEAILGARTYDRIVGACRIVQVTAPSYRRKRARERLEGGHER